ncbi:MAG: 3-beta hydroxysteroid dehydrogenase [Nitrospinaceae bacterium]|nr:MAG: 3-beta hydroxysteroid dehydrogenase [Nitrospinaceae bacterium]
MRVLVTGGGGFLGSHIAKRLRDRGDRVSVLGRRKYSHLGNGIESIVCDIRDKQAVAAALKGCDAVFHAAAVPGVWGDYQKYYSINVEGTRNVIDGCLKHAVKKLIFTSSPSVVFGDSDLENVNESVPYPQSYLCHYPETKAIAERLVVAANGVDGLATVSLRPHLIWGIDDPHLVPRVLDRAQKGNLIRVGDGHNLVDMIHVENAADAHVKAGDALMPKSRVAGQCYFISDGEAVLLWDWIDELLTALDLPVVERTVSYKTAWFLGAVLESIYGLLRIQREPIMTRFVAAQLATSHYFDISKAKRDFGYAPVICPQEGMEQMIKHLRSREAPPAY